MVEPRGTMSLSEQALATTLAKSLPFQALVAAVSPDTTAAHIHLQALPAPASGEKYTRQELRAYRPFALISTNTRRGFSYRETSTGMNGFSCRGNLVLWLERDVPEDLAGDLAASDQDWINVLGEIADSLYALREDPGNLAIRGIDVTQVERTDLDQVDESGDAQSAVLLVSWGAEP